MSKKTLPLKRWSFTDTINVCLLIASILFVIDFKNNSVISWVIVIAFIIWFLTLVARNVYISKIEKQNHNEL